MITIPPTTSAHLRIASELSERERSIISLLQADGRMSIAAISRSLGITQKTVQTYVTCLQDRGIIQFTAVTDPTLLGYHALALVGIMVDPAVPATSIADQLTEIDALDYVVVAGGRINIYAEAICTDRIELQRVIEAEIGRIKGIRDVVTFPYLSLHYQQAHIAAARVKQSDQQGVRPAEISDIDKKIIHALSDDGRASLQKIADELGVSEAQVRQRLKSLTDSGTVSVIALINPMSLEFHAMAWVILRVGPGFRVRDMADVVAQLPYCTYVAICAGGADIFAEFVCRSNAELLDVVDSALRGRREFSAVEIAPYMNLYYKRLTPTRSFAESDQAVVPPLSRLIGSPR